MLEFIVQQILWDRKELIDNLSLSLNIITIII